MPIEARIEPESAGGSNQERVDLDCGNVGAAGGELRKSCERPRSGFDVQRRAAARAHGVSTASA